MLKILFLFFLLAVLTISHIEYLTVRLVESREGFQYRGGDGFQYRGGDDFQYRGGDDFQYRGGDDFQLSSPSHT